jgi:hypothetical protein
MPAPRYIVTPAIPGAQNDCSEALVRELRSVIKVPVGALANVRSLITESGRMAVNGHSFVAACGQNPMSADTQGAT